MVVCCCVRGCSNDWKPNSTLRFHRFPLANPYLLDKWLRALNLGDFAPKSHSRICSSHFVLEDYFISNTPGKRTLLKPHAIPLSFVIKKRPGNSRLQDNHSSSDINEIKDKQSQLTHYDNKSGFHEDEISGSSLSHHTNKYKEPSGYSHSREPESILREVHEFDTQRSLLEIFPSLPPSKVIWRRKIKLLQQKLRRRDEKIVKMRKHIVNLRNEDHACEKIKYVLKKHFNGFSAELFKHQYKNSKVKPKQRRYSEAMKRFSVKLYLYSPSAYKFVRNYLQLPHTRSLLRKQLPRPDDSQKSDYD